MEHVFALGLYAYHACKNNMIKEVITVCSIHCTVMHRETTMASPQVNYPSSHKARSHHVVIVIEHCYGASINLSEAFHTRLSVRCERCLYS